MKVSLKSIPHISSKIAIDLNKSDMVSMTKGLEKVAYKAELILIDNVKKELALEDKVYDICEDNEEEIEFMLADERQLFFMIKKKLAPSYDVILNYEDRYSEVSHKILDVLYEEDLIRFYVAENRIKNIIYNSITSFIADNSEIEDAVIERIRSYKKRYEPGSLEFDILYEKLYGEELLKRGMK